MSSTQVEPLFSFEGSLLTHKEQLDRAATNNAKSAVPSGAEISLIQKIEIHPLMWQCFDRLEMKSSNSVPLT